MSTELKWIDGPWVGRLAVSSRPRGGDWLEDEVAHWKANGVDVVVSLLTGDEERQLDLLKEGLETRRQGMDFRSFPILDRDVPASRESFAREIEELERELCAGRHLVVHCRQGVGRTGIVASCLLVLQGVTPEEAVMRVSEARGVDMPETEEQRRWIDGFAQRLSLLAQ